MARQNAEMAFEPRHGDFAHRFAQKLALRGDDHELDGVRNHFRLRARLHFFGLGEGFLDGADHVEGLLRNFVVLAFDDFLEAAHSVFDLDVLAFEAGELRGDVHRLREEFFNAARARHGALVFIGQFFDTENGDDVLEVLVTLEDGLHAAGDGVVFCADDARIENARIAGQRIDGGINSALDDLTAEVGGSVQMGKGGGRRGVGVVVGGHVDGLHRSDGAGLGGGDALLKFADFGVQVGLITDGGGHAVEERGNFRAGLNEAENIVDEEEHVEMLLIAEIFRDREAGKAHAKTRSGRFGHLAIDEGGAGLFGIAGYNDAGFLEFEPEVVAFAGAFADAGENGNTAVLHGDVVNQFLNQNGFADAGAAEEADFAALQKWLDEVDDFDSGLKHFEGGGLIVQQRRGTVNGIVGVAGERTELVDRLAENVHHAAERGAADGDGDAVAGIHGFHTADQAFGGLHGDRAHAAFAEMLLDFGGDVDGLGHVEAVAGDTHRVVNRGEMTRFKLNVQHRSDDLDDVAGSADCCCHLLLLTSKVTGDS